MKVFAVFALLCGVVVLAKPYINFSLAKRGKGDGKGGKGNGPMQCAAALSGAPTVLAALEAVDLSSADTAQATLLSLGDALDAWVAEIYSEDDSAVAVVADSTRSVHKPQSFIHKELRSLLEDLLSGEHLSRRKRATGNMGDEMVCLAVWECTLEGIVKKALEVIPKDTIEATCPYPEDLSWASFEALAEEATARDFFQASYDVMAQMDPPACGVFFIRYAMSMAPEAPEPEGRPTCEDILPDTIKEQLGALIFDDTLDLISLGAAVDALAAASKKELTKREQLRGLVRELLGKPASKTKRDEEGDFFWGCVLKGISLMAGQSLCPTPSMVSWDALNNLESMAPTATNFFTAVTDFLTQFPNKACGIYYVEHWMKSFE